MKRRENFRIESWRRKYDRSSGTFQIDIRYKSKTEITPRTIGVAEAFGLGVDDYREHVIYDNVSFKIGARDIVYLTGESGSGKSVLLRAFERDLGDEAVNVDDVKVDPDKPIIDTVGSSFEEALELLSRVGLNDAHLFIRRYRQLSDGQKYRYRLAKLIESGKQWWILDEFCATLDRDMAKIVAFNVQKQARRTGRAVIAATTHTDLFEDYAPSVHIHKGWGKRVEVHYYPNRLNKVCSVTRDMHVEEGSYEDYKRLSEFHYRNTKRVPVVQKIYKLMRGQEIAGVIVYVYPMPSAAGRKKATGYAPRLKELNEKWAAISRVVLHPKYRSIGLGVKLVKETLPLVGKPYVEVAAVMARYNPFFEKAGMQKIVERGGDRTMQNAVRALEKLGFKPYLLASEKMNLQHLKTVKTENVKKALLGISKQYYRRLMSVQRVYPRKADYIKFILSADLETLAKVLRRLAVLSQIKVYLFWQKKGVGW